jgi:hypothetical protein
MLYKYILERRIAFNKIGDLNAFYSQHSERVVKCFKTHEENINFIVIKLLTMDKTIPR